MRDRGLWTGDWGQRARREAVSGKRRAEGGRRKAGSAGLRAGGGRGSGFAAVFGGDGLLLEAIAEGKGVAAFTARSLAQTFASFHQVFETT